MVKHLDDAIKKDEENEKLTFGELKKGDWFICVPVSGDNKGHGGYKGIHYIFVKSGRKVPIQESGYAKRLSDGVKSTFPNSMEVIPVK